MVLGRIVADRTDQARPAGMSQREHGKEIRFIEVDVQFAIHGRSGGLDIGDIKQVVVGSTGKSRTQHLAHAGPSPVAAGKIRIAADFLSPRFAQGRANLAAAILEISQLYLAFDFDAERAEAIDQQCFMLILRKNKGEWKWSEALPKIPERNAGGGPGLDPKIHSRDLVAAVNHILSESELLIELERAALNSQRARRGAGGRELVDDSDAYPESGQPQRQDQACRTCANDEYIGLFGVVDLAHSGKS